MPTRNMDGIGKVRTRHRWLCQRYSLHTYAPVSGEGERWDKVNALDKVLLKKVDSDCKVKGPWTQSFIFACLYSPTISRAAIKSCHPPNPLVRPSAPASAPGSFPISVASNTTFRFQFPDHRLLGVPSRFSILGFSFRVQTRWTYCRRVAYPWFGVYTHLLHLLPLGTLRRHSAGVRDIPL